MTGTFKKAAVAGAVALAFSASAFAVPITNGIVSADVNASGTFASLSYLGNEFVAWGSPMSYYWLTSSAGTAVANNASSTNPLGATTFGGGTFTFTSNSGGLVFNETISLIGNKAVVGVSLTNTTGSAITGVQWSTGIDPDQGMPTTFATANSIVGQGGAAAVKASDIYSPMNSVTLRNTTSSGAYTIKAYIDGTCCSPVDPVSILGGPTQGIGSYGFADDSISLAYDIGTIAAGTSASVGYEYVFSTTPVPEPETYAMLLAGLGLMGFVARRRKQRAVAI